MNKRENTLLIIVPAFNEEKNLPRTLEDLKRHCPEADYIVINDGSSDDTVSVCMEKGADVLDIPVNLGLAGAFQTGMKYALRMQYGSVLQFDGDGQHCAEYIPAMVRRMEEKGCDVVIGSRYIDGKKRRSWREIGSRIIGMCIRMTTGQRITDPTSGMRLYDLPVMEKLAKQRNYSPEPDTIAMLLRTGAAIEEVPVRMREREYGSSYLTFGKSLAYMFHVCMSILFINWLR